MTQSEFNYILGLKKTFQNSAEILLGPPPMKWSREIIANQTRDLFLLDFRRGSLEIVKYTYNKRFRNSVVLVRYDSVGKHTNPPGTDGASFDGSHIHIYREGFDDKWAFPVSEIGLSGTENIDAVLDKLLDYCNIAARPIIKLTII